MRATSIPLLILWTSAAFGSPSTWYQPKNLRSTRFHCDIAGDGALRVAVGETTFSVRSQFSAPGGGWLAMGGGTNSIPLKIKGWRVEAATAQYTLRRTITVRPNRISVADRIENRTDRLLGVRFANEVTTDGDTAGSTVCGNLPLPAELSSPERSFVHLVSGNASVALVARDDVYRNQSVCYGEKGTVGVRSDHFGLGPKGSYLIKWELYPRENSDYYDFINTVRQSWGTADFRIPCASGFLSKDFKIRGKTLTALTDPELKQYLDFCAVGVAIFQCSARRNGVDIEAFGSDYLNSARAYATESGRLARRLKKVAPRVVSVGPYSHFSANPRDDVRASEYEDARVMLEGGKQKTLHVEQKQYLLADGSDRIGYYYPTLSNRFGKAMFGMYRQMKKDFGEYNYLDEFSVANVPIYLHGVPDWDGHSVLIDPKSNEPVSKVTSLALITRAFCGQVADEGPVRCANWQPTTEADTRRRIVYFLENHSAFDYPRGHLATPIQYVNGGLVRAYTDYVKLIRDCLEGGILAGVDGALWLHQDHESPLAHFFPITIREIHAGYILGKERIITARNGMFGFGDDSKLSLFVIHEDGTTTREQAPQVKRGKNNFAAIDLPPGQIAVIVRKGRE